MSIVPTYIKVVPGIKDRKMRAVHVIAQVRNEESIVEGHTGAYIVGVFACRDVTENRYVDKKSQWGHCIFKKQWEDVLDGKDTFTDEEKALVLAGRDLCVWYPHGWGNKALAQEHVIRIMDKWSKGSPGESSVVDDSSVDKEQYTPTLADVTV